MSRPSTAAILLRIARVSCPACGEGRIYSSHFVRARKCARCGWVFERGEGFWIGGSEVHMFASYGLSVLIFVPILVLAGNLLWVKVLAIVGHAALSLLLFRYSRAVFIGIDFLLDPVRPPAPDDGWEYRGVGPRPRPRPPRRLRSVPRRPSRRPSEAVPPRSG